MRLEKFSHGWFAFLAIFALFFGACGESSSEDSVNAPKTSENFSESPEGSNSSSGSTFGTLTDIRDGQTYKTVTKRQTATVTTTTLPTAPSMVAFIPGLQPWIVLAHGARTARAAAIIGHAHRHTRCVAFVPMAGICRLQRSGRRLKVKSSSPRPGGITVATERMPSGSRHSLPASGTSVGISARRATMRTSGVLRWSTVTLTSRTS